MIVVGSKKTAVFDDTEPDEKLRLYTEPVEAPDLQPRSTTSVAAYESVTTSKDEPLVLEARHFVSAILDDLSIPTDAAEGRAVVATLEAGYRSLRARGETVTLGARAFELSPEVLG
jgi:UDP-2-acetamido-3-amino-2,3-dideoxy-glucuronate N-acetyltransferase